VPQKRGNFFSFVGKTGLTLVFFFSEKIRKSENFNQLREIIMKKLLTAAALFVASTAFVNAETQVTSIGFLSSGEMPLVHIPYKRHLRESDSSCALFFYPKTESNGGKTYYLGSETVSVSSSVGTVSLEDNCAYWSNLSPSAEDALYKVTELGGKTNGNEYACIDDVYRSKSSTSSNVNMCFSGLKVNASYTVSALLYFGTSGTLELTEGGKTATFSYEQINRGAGAVASGGETLTLSNLIGAVAVSVETTADENGKITLVATDSTNGSSEEKSADVALGLMGIYFDDTASSVDSSTDESGAGSGSGDDNATIPIVISPGSGSGTSSIVLIDEGIGSGSSGLLDGSASIISTGDGKALDLGDTQMWRTLSSVSRTSIVPEPSTFGLLAGLGALVLAISRRRRSR